MPIIGRSGGNRFPVPTAPNANNSKIQKVPTQSSIIRSVSWGRDQAGINDDVSIHISLNRPALKAIATVEIFFNGSGGKPHPFDNPITFQIAGTEATGHWRTKAPRMNNWTAGYFTFRVWVDGQMMMSGPLRLTDNPVARAVQRINTDGFDG